MGISEALVEPQASQSLSCGGSIPRELLGEVPDLGVGPVLGWGS